MYDNSYHHADEVLKNSLGNAVFIGDCSAAEDIQWLRQNGVYTVITAAKGFKLNYDSSIRHIVYDLQDSKQENISKYFDMAAFQIDKNLKKNSVLVHCGAGVSRSSSLVIAYLIKYKNMTFLDALRFLKSKRPQVCPNLGFELQLKIYEKNQTEVANIFLLTHKKKSKNQEFPDLVKKPALQSTYARPFVRSGRDRNEMLGKSLKPIQKRQNSEVEYLRKMAQFRFGITNMSLWKSHQENSQKVKRPFHW